jgi:hypothetical protein
MKLEVQKKLEIDDGLHKGVIINVEYREKPFAYTDVSIEFDAGGKKMVMKSGYPTTISESSKLGKLLQRFGAVLKVGNLIDPGEILVGKPCSFMTLKEGEYSNVLPDSLKP